MKKLYFLSFMFFLLINIVDNDDKDYGFKNSYKFSQSDNNAFAGRNESVIEVSVNWCTNPDILPVNATSFELELHISSVNLINDLGFSQVPFKVSLDDMDVRITTEKEYDVFNVFFNRPIKKTYILNVKPFENTFRPLELKVEVVIENDSLSSEGKPFSTGELLYKHGCGIEFECQTGLSISLIPERKEFVMDKDREVVVNAIVENKADTAYQLQIQFVVSDGVTLQNSSQCFKSQSSYICNISEPLEVGKIQNKYIFEVVYPNHSLDRNITIFSNITAFGVNQPGYKNNYTLSLPVHFGRLLINSSQSSTNVKLYGKEDKEHIQNFTVLHNSSSPTHFDFNLTIPVLPGFATKLTNVTGIMESIDPRRWIDVDGYRVYKFMNITIDRSNDVVIFTVTTILNTFMIGEYLKSINEDKIVYEINATIRFLNESLTQKSTTIIELKTSLPPRGIKDEKDETSSSYRPYLTQKSTTITELKTPLPQKGIKDEKDETSSSYGLWLFVLLILSVIFVYLFWKYKIIPNLIDTLSTTESNRLMEERSDDNIVNIDMNFEKSE
ncbi:uncharacterized protein LOC143200767 isoform X3 [Rhynchophorus ferrugineus]|uniref:uncharacterized protein LOC143200767 isoform X3 n=1 Tax=Rhynchophorus ferrugineus TaxID=354439 RepID=UPI003FCDACD7